MQIGMKAGCQGDIGVGLIGEECGGAGGGESETDD